MCCDYQVLNTLSLSCFVFAFRFCQQLLFFHMAIFYRDIPMPLVTSGVEHGNLRELALARMKDLGTEVSDILS